jgi:hydrogenase 3 maturation protease
LLWPMNFNEFAKELESYPPANVLFVALGNEYRGDDGAGLVFLDKLQELDSFTGAGFLKVYTNPENNLQQILASNAGVVVFIDAAHFGGEPGEIKWLDGKEIDNAGISTHAFSMQLVEKYLLNNRPFIFKYLGIEPLRTDVGDHISPLVLTSIAVFFAHI